MSVTVCDSVGEDKHEHEHDHNQESGYVFS